mgnify:CR=1 FL=1
MGGVNVNLSLRNLFTLTIPQTTTWFFKVIVAIYIVSFFVFRWIRSAKNRIITLSFLCLAYYIIAAIYLPKYWYSSVLCFPTGMIIAYNKEKLNNESLVSATALVAAIIFCVFILFMSKIEWLLIIISLSFSLVCVYIFRYVNINCSFLRYIGKQSLQFYLFQLIPLELFLGINESYYILSILFITPLLVFLYDLLIEKNKYLK